MHFKIFLRDKPYLKEMTELAGFLHIEKVAPQKHFQSSHKELHPKTDIQTESQMGDLRNSLQRQVPSPQLKCQLWNDLTPTWK